MTVRIEYHPRFKKQYKKLPSSVQALFEQRIKLLIIEPDNPTLRVHALKAEYEGYLSMNVTGDIRALFYYEGTNVVVFGFIGTHSQLYG